MAESTNPSENTLIDTSADRPEATSKKDKRDSGKVGIRGMLTGAGILGTAAAVLTFFAPHAVNRPHSESVGHRPGEVLASDSEKQKVLTDAKDYMRYVNEHVLNNPLNLTYLTPQDTTVLKGTDAGGGPTYRLEARRVNESANDPADITFTEQQTTIDAPTNDGFGSTKELVTKKGLIVYLTSNGKVGSASSPALQAADIGPLFRGEWDYNHDTGVTMLDNKQGTKVLMSSNSPKVAISTETVTSAS